MGINSVEENYGPAQYNFEYKVAAKEEDTYISQNEQRDGDNVQGSYSYVDPNGALITVNYEAGPMGYSATTDKQEGFVTVRRGRAISGPRVQDLLAAEDHLHSPL